jgi:YHS domain-containing protein
MGVRNAVVTGLIGACLVGFAAATAADAPGREIPAQFVPFEYLIGSWKGAGIPAANRTRGWPETHAWAWKFEKGNPVGLSVEITGGKVLAKAQLSYDAAKKQYVLTTTDPAGKPSTFTGAFDKTGKQLMLDRLGANSAGTKQRLIFFPNANFVRYTLRLDEQETGAPQYKATITSSLTKEGESFAAGTGGADLPKCIITGGAATMTVSFKGTSYPLCCTGCRDEFNDNPEKYIKKLALMRESSPAKGVDKPKSSPVVKDDGSFDGLTDDPKPAAKSSTSGAMKKAPATASDDPSKPATKSDSSKPADASRAATTLRLAQNLEKTGKTAAALSYYRRIVKDYPGTTPAKTAAERIKVLEGN